MKSWLTIIGFACSHAATVAARPTRADALGDQPARCCCCEPGNCSCPCMPPPTHDPQPRQSKHAGFCSCDDQPAPLPESHRPAIQRLSELDLNVPPVDAPGLDQGDRPADAHPQAHGPPPHLALVRTFIRLT
jgi:hypothetical protein